MFSTDEGKLFTLGTHKAEKCIAGFLMNFEENLSTEVEDSTDDWNVLDQAKDELTPSMSRLEDTWLDVGRAIKAGMDLPDDFGTE